MNKQTIEKRDNAARDVLRGLKSDNPDVRFQAYKKAVKVITDIQRNLTDAIMPCQEVQVPFIMVALLQCIRGISEQYSQYTVWADYIDKLLKLLNMKPDDNKAGGEECITKGT